ncbi:MAG: YkvA family protein [Rhodospirillales bacterium]
MDDATRTYERERRVRREMMAKVRATLGRVPFAETAVAAYLCAIDPETPKRVKAVLLGALVYFIMPVDAIPDVIAALGFTDDAAVFWAAFNSVRAHIRPRHTEEAARRMANLRGDPPGE